MSRKINLRTKINLRPQTNLRPQNNAGAGQPDAADQASERLPRLPKTGVTYRFGKQGKPQRQNPGAGDQPRPRQADISNRPPLRLRPKAGHRPIAELSSRKSQGNGRHRKAELHRETRPLPQLLLIEPQARPEGRCHATAPQPTGPRQTNPQPEPYEEKTVMPRSFTRFIISTSLLGITFSILLNILSNL